MIESLKKKFLNRKPIKGAMIFDFFSPGIPYVIKNSGCEFVIYDMEHGGLTLDKFKELSLISKGIGLNPMIRIPEISYNYISRSLDLGANGIMIPMVNDHKEALEIVKYSKYPPLGRRGAGFGFAHNEYRKENPIDVMEYANKTLINIIQIENESGLENVSNRIGYALQVINFGKSWEDIFNYPNKIDSIDKKEVVRVANKYFNNNYLVYKSRMGRPKKSKLDKPPYKPVKPKNTESTSSYAKRLENVE